MKSNNVPDNNPPGSEAAVRQELQAAYARAGQAWKQKNAADVMAMVTPDFIQKMPGGQTIGRQEAEMALNEWFATPDTVTRYSIQIRDLTVAGDEALALVDESVSMTYPDPQGQQHERVQANTAQMTWVRTATGWQIRHSEYLTAKMTVDGTPVTPLGMTP